jgi:outer membrane protein assembly factor BamB
MMRFHTFDSFFRRRLLILPVLALLLAGCGTGALNTSWPGLLVQGDTAYLAFNNHISAVNLADGAMRWQYPAKGKMEATLNFYSDPILDSSGKLVTGAYDGSVVQLDPANGNLVWRNTDNKKRILAPVLEGPDGKYYVSPEDAGLAILNPADGAGAGTIPLDGGASSWGVMAADDETLFVATLDHKLIALNVATGKQTWMVDLGVPVAGGVRLLDGTLYLGTFDDKALAVDARTGDTIWEVTTKTWVWQPPVVQDGTAYIVDISGALMAVNAADGKTVWSATLDGPVQAALVVDTETGAVFVGQKSGKVRAFSAADGKPIWEVPLTGAIYGTLQISGGRLLVPMMGGEYQLVSLLASSGATQWSYKQPTE